MPSRFSSMEATLQAIARGEVVIVVDAEDRENEGDFVCSAELLTPEKLNFIRKGGGVLCAPMLNDTFERLNLELEVKNNNAPLQTAFTVQVDHHSCKSGITAIERCNTISAMADPTSKAKDFVRPGHVHGLLAKEGGVLRRAGHTEAAIDLLRLAGMIPVAAICEILNEEGDRASRDEMVDLARKHQLEIISIEEIIRYRRVREKLVNRTAEAMLPTNYGNAKVIAYSVCHETQEPIVLVFGEPEKVTAPLVRLHSSCFTGDLLESLRCDCGDQLHMAMKMIQQEGAGVLVYLPQEGRGIGLTAKIKAYALQDQGLDTVEANLALGYKADSRDYGVGIQILKDLGLSKVRLLTNNPKKTNAFIYGGFDLQVVDQIPIVPPMNEYNANYLSTKRDKMGHHLPEDE